jgi:hypothetical protein
MTKNSLKQLIKEMVQQEVREVLPSLLPQIMAEVFSSKVGSTSEPVKKTIQRTTQSVVVPPPKKEYKIFTKNEALNKVLNETVGGVPQEGSLVSSNMGQLGNSVLDHIENIPAPIASAFTKNYSSLMKAIDKKKSGGSSSSSVSMM